jgi:hypothetical protein
MNKFLKIYTVFLILLGLFLLNNFSSSVYADMPIWDCPTNSPGQDPNIVLLCTPVYNHPRRPSLIILYAAIGGGVVILTGISAVVLFVIRKKSAK